MLLFVLNQPQEYWLPLATSVFLAALIGMTIHEFAHNYVATLAGDPMPKRWGKLTFNPLVHINPAGFLMFLVIGFGVLGTAPIDPYRMPIKNRRWGYFAAVAAGPLSNLLLAIIVGLVFRFTVFNPNGINLFTNPVLFSALRLFVFFNVWMFVFNLLPLFPIDGWHMVFTLLPAELAVEWQRQAQVTQFLFMVLLFASFIPTLGFNPLGTLLIEPANFIMRLITGF